MLKTRFLALVAAFAVGFAPMLASAAAVKAPVVYDAAGRPIQTTPVINVDTTGTYVAPGGGGGGGAATIASGADVVEGSTSDTSTSNTIYGVLQALKAAAQDLTTPAPIKIDQTSTNNNVSVIGFVPPYAATITTTITRPADTTAYTANDAWADSTSAPTSGGFTLTGACRTTGGSGLLTSLSIVSSIDPTTLLQGELWLADSAVTAVNDNAAFALSDADAAKIVPGGVIPFALFTSTAGSGTNSIYTATNLNVAYTCVGTANLRFLIKVKNGYTPASAEALTLRAAVVATN